MSTLRTLSSSHLTLLALIIGGLLIFFVAHAQGPGPGGCFGCADPDITCEDLIAWAVATGNPIPFWCVDSCATNPGGEGCSCSKTNACNTTSGTISGGTCNAAEPAACSCDTHTCYSATNACGETSAGSYQTCADGSSTSCSAGGPPTETDVCPDDPGVQCTGPCAGAPPPPAPTCDTNPSMDGCPCPFGYSGSYPSCVAIGDSCTPDTSCAANTCNDGSTCTATAADCSTYQISGTNPNACGAPLPTGGGGPPPTGGGGGPSCTDGGPLTLTASPGRVVAGVPTTVRFTWNVSDASGSCTLSGAGIPTQTTAAPSSCSISGTYTAALTLTQQTTYTLSCPGGQVARAILNIVTKYQEF
jgi:hypothetical protein